MKKSEIKLLALLIGGYFFYKLYYKKINPPSKDVITSQSPGLKTTSIIPNIINKSDWVLSTSITGKPIYLPPGAVS